MEWDQIHDDHNGSGEDAGGARTRHCTANDEGGGIGSSAAYCRTNFEQGDGVEEDPLGVVKGVDSAHEELEGAAGEHVGTGIPSDVVEGVELIGDCRDSGDDDCAILCCD